MRHSWNEQADGTARCRRCPAIRSNDVRSVVRERGVVGVDQDGVPIVDVEMRNVPVIVVDGGHATKCRPGRS